MDDEKLKLTIKSLADNQHAIDLIKYLIELSGCFSQGIAKDERTACYNAGRRDFGLMLRDWFIQYAPKVKL